MNQLSRILLLLAGSALLLGWVIKHSEPTSNVGLRFIEEARQIERGGWREVLYRGIDHPLHPLGIASAHRLFDNDSPGSWERAALLFSFASALLFVVASYLVGRELFGEDAAIIGAILGMANPLLGSLVVNVQSETSFLLSWSFGLWAAMRFLREGRLPWLAAAVALGALAYLTRPEGILLPTALGLTMLVLPLSRASRINWPRWWAAIILVTGGVLLLSGPFVAIKGGLGTKPGIARVLGLAPHSAPQALEREEPLPADQTTVETYRLAALQTVEAISGAVTPPLVPFAFLGIIAIARRRERAREVLLAAIILVASAIALGRLHATGGYLGARHAVIPGAILTIAAGAGICWLTNLVAIPGRWFGRAEERFRVGPPAWAAIIAACAIVPYIRSLGPAHPGPFAVYYDAGDWIAEHARPGEKVLDLTDWSLFFSGRDGYRFADLYKAPADPLVRWVVTRTPDDGARWHYRETIAELLRGRTPVAVLPARTSPGELQIRIYDCLLPVSVAATAEAGTAEADYARR